MSLKNKKSNHANKSHTNKNQTKDAGKGSDKNSAKGPVKNAQKMSFKKQSHNKPHSKPFAGKHGAKGPEKSADKTMMNKSLGKQTMDKQNSKESAKSASYKSGGKSFNKPMHKGYKDDHFSSSKHADKSHHGKSQSGKKDLSKETHPKFKDKNFQSANERHQDKHSDRNQDKRNSEQNKANDKSLSGMMAKKKTPVDAKKSIGSNPPKKQKKKEEYEDEILETDEELGGEEIPDLSEFEEDLEAEADETVESIEVETEEVVTVVSADTNPSNKSKNDEEVILTDAEGRRYCRVRECDQAAIVEGYCRFHYLALWKKIQIRRKILIDGKLERYVEELTAKYPDKFLEVIRKDLRSEKDFLGAIAELEIDDSSSENELEDEAQSFIDEVRGMSEPTISEDDEY